MATEGSQLVKPCDSFMQVVPITSSAMATQSKPQACDKVGVKALVIDCKKFGTAKTNWRETAIVLI